MIYALFVKGIWIKSQGFIAKGGYITASNFRISMHRDNDNFQITLAGDFDGTSACELLNVLKKKCNGRDRVISGNSASDRFRALSSQKW